MPSDISQSTVKINALSNIYTYRKLVIGKLKHEYEITVSSDYIKQKMGSRLQEIAKNAKLPGFRSGKMPYDLVVTNYKSEALKYVVNNAIDYCSSDLMEKIGIKSHIYPKVNIISLPNPDKKDEKGNFIYRLSFESMSEIPAIDLDKINLKKIEAKIEEEDIKEFIDSIKIKFPDFISINNISYQAQNGDKLVIDFKGRIRNKLFRGGSNKNFKVILGSGTFINGFEDKLIGMKKGETKNFKLKFPESYQVISLAGQEADFFVLVNDIQVIQRFGNDDEVAKKMGFENYSLLKDYAKKTISDHCKKMEEFLIKKELFDYLDANYSFGLPMDIVKQEQQKIKGELLNPKDDSCKEAKRRVKLAVLFMKFSTEHKISLTQNDILSVVMKRYTNKDMPFDKVVKYLNSNKQFHGLVEGQALEDKVTDYIMEKVNKREQIVSVRELKKLFNNINNI